MVSTFGRKVVTTVFGESHGPGIGLVLDGLPAGEAVDLEALYSFMKRRAPGQSAYTTSRKEEDRPEFISGLRGETLTGSPLMALIKNKDQRSLDYKNILDCPRPSHADYVAHIKYGGYMDMRGGGPFSGRLTAPLCIGGGIALQILARRGLQIGTQILSLGEIEGQGWDPLERDPGQLEIIREQAFPTRSESKGREMMALLDQVRKEGDSVGAVIECMVLGLPLGIGEPNFAGLESCLSSAIFAIPGVRGISFGTGFEAARMRGSAHNDQFELVDGEVRTRTNHAGGINGGISNGMPLHFQVAMKPTPSIAILQKSISLSEGREEDLEILGRHDPCIAIRALPVVEAVAALVILDLWEGSNGFKEY